MPGDGNQCKESEKEGARTKCGENVPTTSKIRKKVKRKENSEDVINGSVRIQKESTKTSIRALYLNSRSIQNKVNELTAQIIANEYDLVAITETWLQHGDEWELNIQGYQTVRRDRQEGKGGDVALIFKGDIRVVVRDDIGSMEKKVESIWVEIRNSKEKKSLIGVVYRPPNNDIMAGREINKEITDACKKWYSNYHGGF